MTDSCCGTALSSTPAQMQSSSPRVFRARKSVQSSNRIQLASLHRLLDKHGNEIHLGTENSTKLKTKVDWTRLEESPAYLINRHGNDSEGKSFNSFTRETKRPCVSSPDPGCQTKYQHPQSGADCEAKPEQQQSAVNGIEGGGVAHPLVDNSKNGCAVSLSDGNVVAKLDGDRDCLETNAGDAPKRELHRALGAQEQRSREQQCVRSSLGGVNATASPARNETLTLGVKHENSEKESAPVQLNLDKVKEKYSFALDHNGSCSWTPNQDCHLKVNCDSASSISSENKSLGGLRNISSSRTSNTSRIRGHTDSPVTTFENDATANTQSMLSQAERMDVCGESSEDAKSPVRIENNKLGDELRSSLWSGVQEDHSYPRGSTNCGSGAGVGSAWNGMPEGGPDQRNATRAHGADHQRATGVTGSPAPGQGAHCVGTSQPTTVPGARSAHSHPPPGRSGRGTDTGPAEESVAQGTTEPTTAISRAQQDCVVEPASLLLESAVARDSAPDTAATSLATGCAGRQRSVKRPAEELLTNKPAKILKCDDGSPETNGPCGRVGICKAGAKLDVEKEVDRMLLARLCGGSGGADVCAIGERMHALHRRLEAVERRNQRHEGLAVKLQASLKGLEGKLNAALDALNKGTRGLGSMQAPQPLTSPLASSSNL